MLQYVIINRIPVYRGIQCIHYWGIHRKSGGPTDYRENTAKETI